MTTSDHHSLRIRRTPGGYNQLVRSCGWEGPRKRIEGDAWWYSTDHRWEVEHGK